LIARHVNNPDTQQRAISVLLAAVANIILHQQSGPVGNACHQLEIVEYLQIVEWWRCATGQKVAGSIKDGLIWIFH
jgi:hypothetical protein